MNQINHYVNIFNSVLSTPILPHVEQNEQEDIVVTLDEECLNKLETKKVTTNDYNRCTICLCDIVKDEDIIQLKCSHYFHKDCLKEYLEEYDFKCPVCRYEIGKSKAHV